MNLNKLNFSQFGANNAYSKMKNKLIKHFIKQQAAENTQGVLFILRIRPHNKRADDTHTHIPTANGL